MITDALLLVSDAQAFTDASEVSTHSIDTGAADSQFGTGEPMGFCLTVDVAADHTTGNEAYSFKVIDDTVDTLATTPRTIAEYTFLYTELTAGKKHFLNIPPGFPTQRYIGVQFNGANGTTPTVTCTISLMPLSMFSVEPKSHPIGYTP
jgi:hypothetical protein